MREVGLRNWEVLSLLSRTCNIKTIRELERKYVGVLQADLNTLMPIISKEEKKEGQIIYRRVNVQTKRYYCIVCESKRDLECHLGTISHSYAWLNSLD